MASCVTRLTVRPYALLPLMPITPATQRPHKSTGLKGKCSVLPPSITQPVNCHMAAEWSFLIVDRFVLIVLWISATWSAPFCLRHRAGGTRLDSLSVFFSVSLSRLGKVENWLQVIWRRSYLLLTEEWHHNGAAGVQLPLSRPPPAPPLRLHLSLQWQIKINDGDKSPTFQHQYIMCQRCSIKQHVRQRSKNVKLIKDSKLLTFILSFYFSFQKQVERCVVVFLFIPEEKCDVENTSLITLMFCFNRSRRRMASEQTQVMSQAVVSVKQWINFNRWGCALLRCDRYELINTRVC